MANRAVRVRLTDEEHKELESFGRSHRMTQARRVRIVLAEGLTNKEIAAKLNQSRCSGNHCRAYISLTQLRRTWPTRQKPHGKRSMGNSPRRTAPRNMPWPCASTRRSKPSTAPSRPSGLAMSRATPMTAMPRCLPRSMSRPDTSLPPANGVTRISPTFFASRNMELDYPFGGRQLRNSQAGSHRAVTPLRPPLHVGLRFLTQPSRALVRHRDRSLSRVACQPIGELRHAVHHGLQCCSPRLGYYRRVHSRKGSTVIDAYFWD